MSQPVRSIGFVVENPLSDRNAARERVIRYVVLKLIANGLPHPPTPDSATTSLDAESLLDSYHQRLRLLQDIRCPADRRIETFLNAHLAAHAGDEPLSLPEWTIILDRHGLAREMSLPVDGDSYENGLVSSYRVRNGVLHNPLHDRRTTSGTFHVAEGGLPIPRDKRAVPQQTFAALFRAAFNAPDESLELPFTADCGESAKTFVSLLLRPLVCPAVPGVCSEKRMEIRFFAPGSLVSNLDFVESIFGNAGDPFVPDNDAALDVEHWTGQTGCVILAPHLTRLRKCDVGLPNDADATERQREDGMCWKSEDELYNDGQPFKLTCRDAEGVIVTLIADNYYGYCKKEVKTQISFAANLYGNVEEEHAGGAIAFASFNLGDEFNADSRRYNNRTFDDVARDYGGSLIEIQPEGYGIDRVCPNLIVIPEDARASVHGQKISWQRDGADYSIPLLPEQVYMTPAGYRFQLRKHPSAPTWRLVGTLFEGVFCHKPCTVSGGGKSEISKSLIDYVLYGPIFVADVERDLELVDQIFKRDYTDRWDPEGSVQPDYAKFPSRPVLAPNRSLGSVIKLLTPSVDYTGEYNEWLRSIPGYIYALVFIIKRFHRGNADTDWRQNFSVDIVNGESGHELKYGERKLVGDYLRVGLLNSNTWRTYKLRQDFAAAEKIQTEDDISASVVVPHSQLNSVGEVTPPAFSYKFVANCEFRLFQRPDDAVHRGLDKQCEADLARTDNFIVNFEPLSRDQVTELRNHAVDLSKFTQPMQRLLEEAAASSDPYVVCSATPRLIDGVPSKNPRYLQNRPDLMDPDRGHIARMGVRLFRAIPADEPVHIPVNAVLFGRRNNPPDYERGIRPLAVYNPLHYQELPELFMDFVCSLTGKSPSTTGAGSEGALTKGPFNALLPITDLNNALVSYLLTELAGFSTPAGHIGPNVQVDHDISLLIPEIWCRLSPEERTPEYMIREKLLEKLSDFEHDGRQVPASRLGYRITSRFIRSFVGRIFDNPRKVFDESILKPETQDPAAFADGVQYITEAHERVAKLYFDDGSVEQACPPLKALLHIMVHGQYEGCGLNDPAIRALFTQKSMLVSDWYRERLLTKQKRDVALWQRHVRALEEFAASPSSNGAVKRLEIASKLEAARRELARVDSPEYLSELNGMLGADPMGL
ncbi:hypothetical protein GC176_01450 [bacterium]|nr:hypothetical protein [bacterium]